MPDDLILADEQIERLNQLARRIESNLSCNASLTSEICSACRLSVVGSMQKYLEIHGYIVTKKEAVP